MTFDPGSWHPSLEPSGTVLFGELVKRAIRVIVLLSDDKRGIVGIIKDNKRKNFFFVNLKKCLCLCSEFTRFSHLIPPR